MLRRGRILEIILIAIIFITSFQTALSFTAESGRTDMENKEFLCIGLTADECFTLWVSEKSQKTLPDVMAFILGVEEENKFHSKFTEDYFFYAGNSTISYNPDGQKVVAIWIVCTKNDVIQPGVRVSSDIETKVYEFSGIIEGGYCTRAHFSFIKAKDPSTLQSQYHEVRLDPKTRGVVIMTVQQVVGSDKWNVVSKICAGSDDALNEIILITSDKEEKETTIFSRIGAGSCYTDNLTIHADDPNSIKAEFKNKLLEEADILREELENLKAGTSSYEIPSWIKNTARWWSTDQIETRDYVEAIQFLIKEKVIQIPETKKSEYATSLVVPTWIKNNAGWWADGRISDKDYVNSIQYLMEQGIIQIEIPDLVPSEDKI